jgi:hypothetical protein
MVTLRDVVHCSEPSPHPLGQGHSQVPSNPRLCKGGPAPKPQLYTTKPTLLGPGQGCEWKSWSPHSLLATQLLDLGCWV